MANEFQHKDPGAALTQAEYITTDGTGHIFDSQATGDILYASSSTALSRLAIGSNTNVLEITGGIPAWVASSGTGSVARVTSPTFVTPALGTPASGVMTNVSGTASSLTAGTVTTNANLTGHVTSSGNAAVLGSFTSAQLATALTNETGSGAAVFGTSPTLVTPALGTPASGVATNITGLPIAGIANGTDGELITWNSSGVAATVAVGTGTHVLTSNGAGAAPTFQSAAGGPSQATKSALEAETNENTYAPPDLIKNSPGVSKGYGTVAADGTLQSDSYNITSVVKTATGKYTVTWDVDFGNVNYVTLPQIEFASDGEGAFYIASISAGVGTVNIQALNSAQAYVDHLFQFAAFGDQ